MHAPGGNVELLDPSGKVRAVLPAGAGVLALLEAAWGVGKRDAVSVLLVDDQWELCLLRGIKTEGFKLTPLGHKTPLNRQKEADALYELAWAELLDEGWAVRQRVAER